MMIRLPFSSIFPMSMIFRENNFTFSPGFFIVNLMHESESTNEENCPMVDLNSPSITAQEAT